MQIEKFKVINFIRELIINIDKNLENFPKKDIEIKNRIKSESYNLLEYCYEANTTEDNNLKIQLLNKCIAKIKVVDFLINISYDKQIINNKRYLKFGESADEIAKYLVGWKKSINRA
ncbi:MAG: four helix bundle protein [Clostridia bacterium]|nr:four helix bundle protein [Clostridia bacterium]